MKIILITIALLIIAWSGIALAQDAAGDPSLPTAPAGVLQTVQLGIYTVMQIWAKAKTPEFKSSFKSKEFLLTAIGMILTTIQQIVAAIPSGVGAP